MPKYVQIPDDKLTPIINKISKVKFQFTPERKIKIKPKQANLLIDYIYQLKQLVDESRIKDLHKM